jgi:putative ABC transport system ATP-binding protein
MTVPALEASELYRFFHVGDDEIVALRGVDIALASGEFVALRGPSGGGKSTLLACLAGLDEPDGGTVALMGERLTRRTELERARLRARHLGLLMQAGNLFEHLTIRGSILLQIKISGRGDPAEIESLLASLGLSELAHARPAQLSGGEAARAALAVAIAAKPPILLCDEPTAEVDAQTERHVVDRLIELRRE